MELDKRCLITEGHICLTRLTRRVSLVKQELPTLPEHLSCAPFFSGVPVTRSFILCVMFCRSLFVLFLLAIMLSVLLRFTDSDYLFGIFKLCAHVTKDKLLVILVHISPSKAYICLNVTKLEDTKWVIRSRK